METSDFIFGLRIYMKFHIIHDTLGVETFTRDWHPLCRLKNPTVISIWLLVGFHPATRSVHSTPADNTRKRVWQYIEKERKKLLLQCRAYNTAFS